MKKISCVVSLLFSFFMTLNANDLNRRMLVGGCGLGKIMLLDGNSSIIWQTDEKREVSDIWLLKSGNIIHSNKHGIQEIKPNYALGKGAKTVWEVKAPKGAECHACQPIGEDRFLVGYSHKDISYLVEVDSKGNEYKRIKVEGQKGMHSSFRQVRKTTAGTYLTSQQARNGKAREYNANGKMIRMFPDGRYTAERLANGNTLLACGDTHRLIEVDKDNTIVWEVNQNDVPGVTFGFIAGVKQLANGNLMICNWGGHGKAKGGALVEISRDKKLVWSTDKSIRNRVSCVYMVQE